MAGDESERRIESDEGERTSDVEVLRSGREEARIVLDHQLQMLDDMHTKAVRTVRITVLVLGLALSATAFPDATKFSNWFTLIGVGTLAVAILSGLVVYTAPDPKVGVGPLYLSELRTSGYDESEWFGALIEGYEEWIVDMEELNRSNARLLGYTQGLLGLGVVLLLAGFLVGIAG